MDAELWAALSGYDVALQRAYKRRRISTPRHGTAGRIFCETMPHTLEDVRLFCYRIFPAVDRSLAYWRPLDKGVSDALERFKRYIRFVLEQDDEARPGASLVYEELNLE